MPQVSIPKPSSGQCGFALLEALISILIFSIGILGIVALQAVSVTNSSANRYRITASFLADQLIGQMWVSNRDPATLQANFQSSTGGANYTAWRAQVNSQLPMAGGTAPPSVVVTPAAGSATQSLVTVQIFWTMPDGTTHNYVVTDEISQYNQ
jgi:type IV pilus assembly protein PilV